jgi:Co/Zn/Cd efflux system component
MAAEPLHDDAGDGHAAALRRVVLVIAALNLSYFGIECATALSIGSVSLFADSVVFSKMPR